MSLSGRLAGEGIGSLFLAATVVGSGVMAERLAGGNVAVALLANTGATVAVLAVLIALFAGVSGAHFNPAVTLVQAIRREMTWQEAAAYGSVQIVACCAGALLAHAMFELPLIEHSLRVRAGPAQCLSEGVATFGLLLVILGCRRTEDAPWMVAGWIGAAYWFTASTSFANPAITIARSISDTFAGIRPQDTPAFILCQLAGAMLAYFVARRLFPLNRAAQPAPDNPAGTADSAGRSAPPHGAVDVPRRSDPGPARSVRSDNGKRPPESGLLKAPGKSL